MYTVDSITIPFSNFYPLYSASAIDVAEVQEYLTKIRASYGLEKKTKIRSAEQYPVLGLMEDGIPPIIIAHIIKEVAKKDFPACLYYYVYPLLTHGVLTRAPKEFWNTIKEIIMEIDYALIEDEDKRKISWAAGLRLLNAIDSVLVGGA